MGSYCASGWLKWTSQFSKPHPVYRWLLESVLANRWGYAKAWYLYLEGLHTKMTRIHFAQIGVHNNWPQHPFSSCVSDPNPILQSHLSTQSQGCPEVTHSEFSYQIESQRISGRAFSPFLVGKSGSGTRDIEKENTFSCNPEVEWRTRGEGEVRCQAHDKLLAI